MHAPFATKLAAVALAAFAIRLGLRLAAGTEGYWIEGYGLFASLADSLAAGDGYAFPGGEPTAFRVPLYAIFITLVTWGTREAWLLLVAQALVSSGTLVIGALIARRLFGNGPALVTAILCAFYPYYAWHDLSLQETGLFTFLAGLATWLLLRERETRRWVVAIIAGFVLGLAILTRSTLLPLALFAVLWLVLPDGSQSLRRRALSAGLVLAGLALCLSPWLIRARDLTGAYGFGTEFGAALYAGNHALTFSHYPEGSIDESRNLIFASHSSQELAELATLGTDEVAVSRWYRERGMAAILADPSMFLAGALRKLGAAFGPLPSPRKGLPATLAYVASWVPVLLLGLVGLWQSRNNWRRDLIFYAHIASFAVISGVLWGHTSHRSYLDIYLMIFASSTLAPGLSRIPGAARLLGTTGAVPAPLAR